MNRLYVRALLSCLSIVAAAAPAMAQPTPSVELSAGYQFLSLHSEDESESLGKGWYVDVVGNINPRLGIVVQVGGNYKSFEESVSFGGITATATADVKIHEFLGGVRLNVQGTPAIAPYVQVLGGAVNGSFEVTSSTTVPGFDPITFSEEDSGTNFGLELGAGANFDLGRAFGLRVGADYIRVFADEGGGNAFRFHAGIVIGR